MINGDVSHWMHSSRIEWTCTKALDATASFDVAIVGGGFTGLWTAWWLLQHAPELSVGLFEQRQLGFGASGRNGGWLSSKTVGLRKVLANSPGGRQSVREMDDVLRRSPAEVVDLLGCENIEGRRGGWMQIARSESERRRLGAYIESSREWGVPSSSLRMLTAEEAYERVRAAGLTGAIYSPDGYTVNPALVVKELADRVLQSGAQIFTNSRAEGISDGQISVNGHRVVARTVVVATEAYTVQEKGQRRRVLPLSSELVVTDPLTDDQWDSVGWSGGEGLAGTAHDYFYGQRTSDGRILIGGSGRPYRYGSSFDLDGRVDRGPVHRLAAVLKSLFPGLEVALAHTWSGVLGVARDWSPYVDLDPGGRLMRIGGYAGQGVTGAYVAGQIAADLILGRDTQLAACPWVRRRPGPWEPEPLRWIGARGLYAAYNLADRREQRLKDGRTSAIAQIADRLARR